MTHGFDLHTHTVFSDGTTTPQDNARLAKEAGLRGLALTDHDTVTGWTQMREACERNGLGFVPGIELSTEQDGLSVHLLGYWVDPEDEALARECDRLRNERVRRAEAICDRLEELNMTVSMEAVRAHAGDAPIGRPHIAAAMVAAGHVRDFQAAFDDYLADGGPAYVPKYAVHPVTGARLLRAAGGAVVLAHPGVSEDRGGAVSVELLDRLTAEGIVGLEVEHPGHEPEVANRWRALARERELLITGSSDFHGSRKDAAIGERTTPVVTVEALAAHARTCESCTVDRSTMAS